jgi:urease accessory protein
MHPNTGAAAMTPFRPAARSIPRTALALALCAPALCLAHVGADAGAHHGAVSALAAGFMHPFTGADHLAAMLVLGVWSALTARRVWLAPLAFAATLAIGALIGLGGGAVPGIEPMIAASLLALGLLLATSAKLPAVAGAVLAAVFALFHGAAHGHELAGRCAVRDRRHGDRDHGVARPWHQSRRDAEAPHGLVAAHCRRGGRAVRRHVARAARLRSLR